MHQLDQNMDAILSDDDISALKGGVVDIYNSTEDVSQSGDGAEYICCIKIKR